MTASGQARDTAKAVVLAAHVNSGVPGPEHFRVEDRDVPPLANEGEILLQVHVMSADPYLRAHIREGGSGPPVGGVMSGFVAGKIIESRNTSWPVGSLFGGALPFQTLQVVTPAALATTMTWNLTDHIREDEISVGLSVLGMPGATAYGGLKDVLRPTKEKETLFVSAAAGAVGSMVGQLGKNVFGLETVGSCGGTTKCELIKNKYGFDHAIDYKALDGSADGLRKALKEAVPNGVDMYFENVGGIHMEAAFASLNPHGRIAVCGMISQYHDAAPVTNNLSLSSMIYKFQRIEGFMCAPWLKGQRGNFLVDMSKWWKEGKVKVEETHFAGIDQWSAAFQSLFTGKKLGKVVVTIPH